jgi:hypothetical protein
MYNFVIVLLVILVLVALAGSKPTRPEPQVIVVQPTDYGRSGNRIGEVFVILALLGGLVLALEKVL